MQSDLTEAEQAVHGGVADTSSLKGPGLGYQIDELIP